MPNDNSAAVPPRGDTDAQRAMLLATCEQRWQDGRDWLPEYEQPSAAANPAGSAKTLPAPRLPANESRPEARRV